MPRRKHHHPTSFDQCFKSVFPFHFRSVVDNLAGVKDQELLDVFRYTLSKMGNITDQSHSTGTFMFNGTLEKVHARTPKISDLFIEGRGFWNLQPLCRYALKFDFQRINADVYFDVTGAVTPNRAFLFNLLFAIGAWFVFYLALPSTDAYRGAAGIFLIFVLALIVYLQIMQQVLVRRFFRQFLSNRKMIGIFNIHTALQKPSV